MKGIFITFEGPEGSGKTTVIERLAKKLEDAGYIVRLTREPGGCRISEDIRSIILDVNNKNMDPVTEALLYAASRRQHVSEVIKPHLDAGHIVICDRFLDSSLVYQGYARNLGIDNVLEINKQAINGLFPDLTIFFDIKPNVGLDRIKDNKRNQNRLDLEKLDFHNRVYEGYIEVLNRFSDRIKAINADLSREEVYYSVEKIVFDFLEKKNDLWESQKIS